MPVIKASPAKKATPGRPKDVDKDLVFLYQMITTQGQFKPEWKVIAEKLGITTNAAHKRWNRIKVRLEDLTKETEGETLEDVDAQDEE
ncbi:uncharacterized protein N7503_009882 [Penicillium pulvis]|uniref:uncharacterized protein n=1 Tax=Penicillium pulvis TaxID=1562058 RepID=UPI002546683F|nr:uncharacterized protein N7503_009882 [Penicillium pulvis]KAJ5784670.1 hypothetical protein N7503_009882 [Penicillium pulvis]